MTDDEALKRGAEAGAALAAALIDVCGDKAAIAIRAAAIALKVLLPAPAEAHCYSIWHYPTPQRCGASASRVRVAVARVQVREVEPKPAPLPVEPVRERPDVPLLLPTMIGPQPVPPPPVEWDDEAMRAIAIERLKEKMNK